MESNLNNVKKKQNIIFKVINSPKGKYFQKFKEEQSKRKYYYYSGRAQLPKKQGGEGRKTITWMKYITREEALHNIDISVEELDDLLAFQKFNNDKYEELTNEYSNRKNSGVWGRQGLMDEEKLNSWNKELLNLDEEQHFWDTVISFDKKFVKKYGVYHPELINSAIERSFETLFEGEDINHNRFNWAYSMHRNTENPHIHLGFFESISDENDNYRNKFNFKKENLEKFRFTLARNIVLNRLNFQEKRDLNMTRNKIMEFWDYERKNFNYWDRPGWKEARKAFIDVNGSYNEMLQKFNSSRININPEFKDKKVLYYSMLDKEQKQTLINFIDELTQLDPEMNQLYNQYKKNVIIYQRATNEANLEEVNWDNGELKLGKEENDSFYQNTFFGKDGFYERVGNKLLKSMKSVYNLKEKTKNHIPRQPIERVEMSIFKEFRNWLIRDIKINNKIINDRKRAEFELYQYNKSLSNSNKSKAEH